MVYDQIHEDLNATFMCFLKKLFIILHGSIFVIDPAVIGNIIAIVILRRFQHGGDPENIYSQLLQIVQFFYNSGNITNSVSVAVVKTSRVDLIYHTFFPPVFFHVKWPPFSV